MEDVMQNDMADMSLYPIGPWPLEAVQPYVLHLFDPFTVCSEDNNAAAAMSLALAGMRADTAGVMASRQAALKQSNVCNLCVTAARGDWFDLEHIIAQVCINLLWTTLLMPEASTNTPLHGEQALSTWLDREGMPSALEPLFQAESLSELHHSTWDMVARALSSLSLVAPDLSIDSEAWIQWQYQTRIQPPPQSDLHIYEQVALRIAESLKEIPVFQGVMIVGSFAENYKHDGFNDLDLHCFCSALPTRQMRTDFFSRLGLEQQGSEIAFEYFQLDGVNVHLCLPLLANQQYLLDRIWQDGDENDCLDFSIPTFAASVYHLTRGRILDDPTGMLTVWQSQLKQYPVALRKRIHQQWRPVWERYSVRVQQALKKDDRIHAFIAMRMCREAYVRMLLANHDILCDPILLKWCLHEVDHLPAAQWEKLMPLISRIRFAGIPTLTEQFAQLHALWEELAKH